MNEEMGVHAQHQLRQVIRANRKAVEQFGEGVDLDHVVRDFAHHVVCACAETQTADINCPTKGALGAPKAIGMNKSAVIPQPVGKTLQEQKSDFTAEGSPPPGEFLRPVPQSSPEMGTPTPAPRPVRATITLKRTAATASP